jgi:hypothetical protein
MGFGAYMKVTNNNPADVRLYIHGIVCMYNGGEEGSDLNYFNGLEVVSGETQPPEGEGEYIEAIASGQCVAEMSTFTIDVNEITGNGQEPIGSVVISEQFNKYYDKTTGAVEAVIDNTGDQATIQVTVT